MQFLKLQMQTLKLLLVFSALASSITSDVENKNWRFKAGLYDEQRKNLLPGTFRLPNNTRPTFYSLYLKTEVDKENFEFKGRVKIEINVIEVTDQVTLHSKDLKIQNVSLVKQTGKVIKDNLKFEYVQPEEHEFLLITLPNKMQIHDSFVLEIVYTGLLQDDGAGFYRAFFYNGSHDENNKVYYAVTQFQPTFARKAFPCYDEPGIRAIYVVQIQHSKKYRAFSNTELVDESQVEGTDQVISRFRATRSMQPYTLAILVAPFDVISNNDRRIPQRVIARPDVIKNGDADFALQQFGPILRKMENHLGLQLPMTKIDHAAVDPFKAGAMENWGLIVYREEKIIRQHSLTEAQSLDAKKYAIQIIAHELAHQFFGNLVAPHWWTDLWLNEGFATFYEYYIPHLLYPDYDFMEIFRKLELEDVFNIDVPNHIESNPLSSYTETPSEIASTFNMISYNKGGAVLRMFQVAYGVETFRKGVKFYLDRGSFLLAKPSDLFSSLQKAVDLDIPELKHNVEKEMGKWVYQAGYPLVRVSVKRSNLILEQHRFPKSKKDEIYSIPLSYATKSNPNFNITVTTLWLSQKELKVPLRDVGMASNDWIILNIQQTGLYRVYYSQRLWQYIVDGLRANINAVHPINREVLITELAIAFFNFDEMLVSGVLEVMLFLVNEDQYSVWNEVEKLMIDIQFHFIGTDAYAYFLKYMRFITNKQIKKLGFNGKPDEPLNDSQLRDLISTYNCFALDPFCQKYQLNQLQLLINGNHTTNINLCAALSIAPQSVYERILNYATAEFNLDTRTFYLLGLTCTRERSQLQQLLSALENNTNLLTKEDKILTVSKLLIASNEAQAKAMEYLSKHPEILANEQIREVLKKSINTKNFEDKVRALIRSALFSNLIPMKDALNLNEGLNGKIKWHKKNYGVAEAWFKKTNLNIRER